MGFFYRHSVLLHFVSNVAVFVLKSDVKLQPTNQPIVLLCALYVRRAIKIKYCRLRHV